MDRILEQVVNEEIKKMVLESLSPYTVIEKGVKVYWKYNRWWFKRKLEGTACGVLTGRYTPEKAYVELTTTGPDSRPPGETLRVSIKKLRTYSDNKPLITPEEYEKKINAASESNIY